MADTSMGKKMSEFSDSLESAIETGKRVVGRRYKDARLYADRGMEVAGDLSTSLSDFVQREPWMAVLGAFVVGYAAAQLLRKISD